MQANKWFLALGVLAGLWIIGPAAAQEKVATCDEEIAASRANPQALADLEKRCIQVLQGDSTPEQKDRAGRILRVIGSPDSIPALAALLREEDTSHLARYVLEPMPYPQADQALRQGLAQASGDVRLGIIHSLGVRQDPEAAAVLIPLLQGSDLEAAAAAWALGRIATPPAARALADLRAAAPPKRRAIAAEASLIEAEQYLARGQMDQAARVYQQLQSSNWPEPVRIGAFVGYLQARPDEAVPIVLRTISGADATMRAVAIDNISTLQGEGIAKRFAAELPKLPAATQVILIDALAARGDRAALAEVTAAAASTDAAVRTAAIRALSVIGDETSVPVLAGALAAGASPTETQAAYAALQRLSGNRVDEAIVRSMKAAETATRTELIMVLSDRRAARAVPDLLAEAAAGDDAVREAAFRALAELAEPQHAANVVRLLVELRGDAVRADAERTVSAVVRRIENQSDQTPLLRGAFDSTRDSQARCSLLRVLKAIGDRQAFDLVRNAIQDQDAAVRDTALRTLADWPDEMALDALLAIYRETAEQTPRVMVLRGIVRLLNQTQRPTTETVQTCDLLLQRARDAGETKLVLACLAKVADPAALKLVEPCLERPDVQAEAQLAALQIAGAIGGADLQASRALAMRIQESTRNPANRRQAQELLQRFERLGDYLVAWQVAGPYLKPDGDYIDLLDSPFPPEEKNADGISWRLLPLSDKAERPWMFDLQAALGGNTRAAYARTWIHSDTEQPARLLFGTDDGGKVWFNEKVVHRDGAGGAAVPDEHQVDVTLQAGWNTLVLKVLQDTGPWEFCLRLRTPAGQPPTGVRVQAQPPQ
ncbi:MAG: HEAT repeat domain-containing protein [Sedimentisphaerales bacterium]|nr:HEAT repeat domain-containing protein [Sedimentisphaerales bacterium]